MERIGDFYGSFQRSAATAAFPAWAEPQPSLKPLNSESFSGELSEGAAARGSGKADSPGGKPGAVLTGAGQLLNAGGGSGNPQAASTLSRK